MQWIESGPVENKLVALNVLPPDRKPDDLYARGYGRGNDPLPSIRESAIATKSALSASSGGSVPGSDALASSTAAAGAALANLVSEYPAAETAAPEMRCRLVRPGSRIQLSLRHEIGEYPDRSNPGKWHPRVVTNLETPVAP